MIPFQSLERIDIRSVVILTFIYHLSASSSVFSTTSQPCGHSVDSLPILDIAQSYASDQPLSCSCIIALMSSVIYHLPASSSVFSSKNTVPGGHSVILPPDSIISRRHFIISILGRSCSRIIASISSVILYTRHQLDKPCALVHL